MQEKEKQKEKPKDSKGRPIEAGPYCDACKYYRGKLIKSNGQHRGTGPCNVEHWSCKKHPACINTMYSLSCQDFEL